MDTEASSAKQLLEQPRETANPASSQAGPTHPIHDAGIYGEMAGPITPARRRHESVSCIRSGQGFTTAPRSPS